ncbi:hypothetical protein MML48_3g00003819 [Holotrichia oblita]|uniref:Uncharacterized protein n=1 Tax=Holotrichia oblita TaxID=644536 RepID=A0ACB9TE57_HOLOL|nr:hypothetical protein MML48_3g00003819 [Holotrichia oblita]
MSKMELYLRTLGDPGFQEGVGADLGIYQSTVSKTINEVASKIVRRKGMWIRFPLTPNELEEAKRGWHMPDAIGAVDCTHIKIRKPVLHGEEYFNRKGFCSINVQATCNYNECFTSVDVSWPGSVHDSRVWRNSDVFQITKSNINYAYLLGDEGYCIAPWLMTPYKNPNIITEKLYNRIHTTDRIIIERCFGQLKSRFPMLANTIGLKLNCIPVYITSCFILHNVAKNVHDPNDFLPLQNREEPYCQPIVDDANIRVLETSELNLESCSITSYGVKAVTTTSMFASSFASSYIDGTMTTSYIEDRMRSDIATNNGPVAVRTKSLMDMRGGN